MNNLENYLNNNFNNVLWWNFHSYKLNKFLEDYYVINCKEWKQDVTFSLSDFIFTIPWSFNWLKRKNEWHKIIWKIKWWKQDTYSYRTNIYHKMILSTMNDQMKLEYIETVVDWEETYKVIRPTDHTSS